MTEKRSKYDTDPLDPDFVRRTEDLRGGPAAETAPQAGAADATMPLAAPTAEEPTRRFDGPPPGEQLPPSYPSVFVPPVYEPPAETSSGRAGYGAGAPPPHAHQAYGPHAPGARPTSRPVQKLGIPENVANVLPYAPFYIGVLAALVELMLVPRVETRTRFHAAQGLALQIVILLASIMFSFIGFVAGAGFGGRILQIASFLFLLYSMWRVWEGRPHHLAPLDELTKQINERFEPRK